MEHCFRPCWVKVTISVLSLGFCLLLIGCGEGPEPPKAPTASDEAVRQQMLEYDKTNKISGKPHKRG